MLKNIMKKLTTLSIICIVLGSLISKFPVPTPTDVDCSISTYGDLDTPETKQ